MTYPEWLIVRDNDEEQPVRAHDRGIMRGGLLRCCYKTIIDSVKMTKIGDQIQCRSCGSYMEVNEVGNWKWMPDQH